MLADVSGKGVSAALLASTLQGMIYSQLAARTGTSEAALKMTVTRMRQRCRELLREGIAHTVTTPAEVEDEYRVLLAALSG